jgi:tRNA-specific 2-thiouridylase
MAGKPDSQDICFIQDNDYPRFLQEHIPQAVKSGPILDAQGHILGEHHGFLHYTIGQRRGLGIAAPHPYYVLELDTEGNRVVAGVREELGANGLVAARVNWISFSRLEGEVEALVQIRYRHRGVQAVLSPLEEGKVRVEFRTPQRSVTPGQAAVFYRNEEVLGGGWIEKAF